MTNVAVYVSYTSHIYIYTYISYIYTHKQKESCIDCTCSEALLSEPNCFPVVERLIVALRLLQMGPQVGVSDESGLLG